MNTTLAVAPVAFAALAVIVAEPGVSPVTGTLTLLELGVNVTVGVTAIAPGLFEVRFTVNPAGGGMDKFN